MNDKPQQPNEDPLIDYYNRLILDPMMRSFYGESLYYNVGFRNAPHEDQATASSRLVELLFSWVPEAPTRVLDVACGLGAASKAAKARWPLAQVTGINISPLQVEHAKTNAPECSFLPMDATSLNFADETFDLVMSIEAAFHFDSRVDFLREAFRVLKKRGTVLLADILFNEAPAADSIAVWPVNRINNVEGMSGYLALLGEQGFITHSYQDALEPCWKHWCNSLRKWTLQKHREGVIDEKSLSSKIASMDSLFDAVKSYPLVCAVKKP